ncbi:MAG: hypothetical protein ACI9K5_004070, partial [Gammaproteobacteria bacterium]
AAISATGWSGESPEGPLCCPSAAGPRPAQAAQRRQDPPDTEAAVVDGDPVHGTRAMLFEPEAFVDGPVWTDCVP